MLKLAGCMLIFAGCTLLGFIKAASYKERRRELEEILELIRLLELEISYRKDSLYKAFYKTGSLKDCWFSHVLTCCSNNLQQQNSMYCSWETAIADNIKNCPLQRKDIDILNDISLGLGKSDTAGQKKLIEPAIIRLEAALAESKEQEIKQGKMYKALGTSAGIAIAVILI